MQCKTSMAYEERRFIRLWSGSSSYLEDDSSKVLPPRKGRKKRRSENERGGKTTPRRGGHQRKRTPSTHSQSLTPPRRPVSSAGLPGSRARGLLITGPAPPPRSHSSLGFSERFLPRPQGFDLQGYVRRHGSASDIRIGINGNTSSDEYFDRYLKECESMVEYEREMASDLCSVIELDTLDMTEHSNETVEIVKSPPPGSHLVPLCWEDQLKKAEPDQIMPKKEGMKSSPTLVITHVPLHKRQSHASTLQHTEATFIKLTEKISVSVMWKESCLLPTIPLRELRGSPNTQAGQRSSSPTFSPSHRVCVIPQADFLPDEEEDGGGGGTRERGKDVNAESEEWSVTDIEATPSSDLHDTELSSEVTPPSSDSDKLSIHFHSTDPNAIKVLNSFTFKVSLLLSARPLSSSPTPNSIHSSCIVGKPQTLSNTECVMTTHARIPADAKASHFTWKLAVTCCSPRVLVFSTDVSVPEEREDHLQQEEDEDKTDMDALAKHFPDLCMVELINKDPPTPATISPAISPAHQYTPNSLVYETHLQNLSTVASQYRGKSLLTGGGRSGCNFKMTQDGRDHGTKYRLKSLHRPAKQASVKTYGSSVKQQLKRYCTTPFS